jgi:Uma2 family endonuclease
MGFAVRRLELPYYIVEDYRQWEGDWELIEGVPYAMAPSPLGRHQRVSGLIFAQIEQQLRECSENCYVYQELDWIIREDTVLRPDLVVVCKKIDEYLRSTPEIVFEIVSKTTAFKDEKLKFFIYEQEGVEYYALVYPEIKKMRVFRLIDNKYKKVFDDDLGHFTFELKCRFSVDLEKIWERA